MLPDALDIHADQIADIQAGADLKAESLVQATAKIVAYCLAVETEALDQVKCLIACKTILCKSELYIKNKRLTPLFLYFSDLNIFNLSLQL